MTLTEYNDSARHIHRLPPCQVYDIEAFQTWLSDMARKGWLLDRDGFFMGFASFEQAEPCHMVYRLQAASKAKSAFEEGEPDAEETELSHELGWDYVARYRQFHIYRTAAPQERELNTDPEIQAMALKKVSSALRSRMISLLLWLTVYPLLMTRGRILLTGIAIGEWFLFLCAFVLIYSVFSCLVQIRSIRALRRRLILGETLSKPAQWQKNALRHRCAHIMSFICTLCLVISFIAIILSSVSDDHLPSEELSSKPFPSLEDIFPDAERTRLDSIYSHNDYTLRHGLLFPVSYEWRESQNIKSAQAESDVNLYLLYHEAASPRLARLLALEYQRGEWPFHSLEYIDLPELDVDYASAWFDDAHFANVVIQKGCITIKACLIQFDESLLSFDEWVSALTDTIRE